MAAAINTATGSLYLALEVVVAVMVFGALLLIGIPAHALHECRAAGRLPTHEPFAAAEKA